MGDETSREKERSVGEAMVDCVVEGVEVEEQKRSAENAVLDGRESRPGSKELMAVERRLKGSSAIVD